MTACNDVQSASFGKKVVGTALAGTLAVGMVPAAAFAADVQDTGSDDGIQALLAGDAFSGGAVTAATYWSKAEAANTDWASGAISIVATGEAIQVVPTEVTPVGASAVTVATVTDYVAAGADPAVPNSYKMADGYTLTYYQANEDGSKGAQVTSVIYPGKYLAVVTATAGNYAGGEIAVPFTVTPASLGTLTVYEVNPEDATDVDDEELTYTGAALNLDVKNDAGEKLKAGEYSIKWLKGGSSVSDPSVSVVDAGTYFGVVTGSGIYAGQTANLAQFEVKKFDLSKATIEVPSAVTGAYPTVPTSVKENGATLVDPSQVKLALSEDEIWGAPGAYTLVATSTNPNILNADPAKTVTINKVEAIATFKYNNGNFADVTIDKSDKNAVAYDTSKITAWNGSKELAAPTVTVSKKEAIVDTTGADDAAKAANDLANNEPGTYTVTATVEPAGTSFAAAGSQSITVKVIKGALNADTDLYAAYNGVSTSAVSVTYGTTIAATDITWAIKGVAGTNNGDVQTKLTDAEGKTVSFPLTNAGSYTLTINPTGYQVTGNNTLPITIEKLNVTEPNIQISTAVDSITPVTQQTETGYTWIDTTAKVDLPTNLFVKAENGTVEYDKAKYNAVASSLANVSWELYDAATDKWNVVTEIPADTTSQVRAIVTSATKDAADNFVFSDEAADQTVLNFEAVPAASIKFVDVLPGSWYFNPVTEATTDPLNYMNGYSGTKLFGPNDKLTRGQAACILYNMAGGNLQMAEGGIVGNDQMGYESYDDVAPKAYYAKAIAWAKAAGVVNGFAGTNDFGPDQTVTREQFACMLWNYAKAVKSSTVEGVDVSAELASKPDGASVSDWAKEGVAWAISDKVIGNGGVINPAGVVTRAEAAAMAVNYQPKPLA